MRFVTILQLGHAGDMGSSMPMAICAWLIVTKYSLTELAERPSQYTKVTKAIKVDSKARNGTTAAAALKFV